MSKILFVMHGMGVHGADWAKPVLEKLDEVAGRYGEFRAGGPALSERVEPVPITYDNVFRDLLKQWSGSAAALGDFVAQNAIPVKPVLQWLEGASKTEANFFWSHVVDVLLYRFFDIKRKEVQARVLDQMVKKLKQEMSGGNIVEASVLTHSLGTSVAHDCLARLGGSPLDGSQGFMVNNFRFSNFFMVANVGRVLETTPPVLQSCVKPASAGPDEAYCNRYYNFRHELDPFPAVRPFNPQNWGEDYRPTENLRHVHEFNVHDYCHYLDHPAVHIPIIRGLLGPVIDDAERQKALDAYPEIKIPNPCLEALQKLRGKLKQFVKGLESDCDPFQFIVLGAQACAAIQEARDACR